MKKRSCKPLLSPDLQTCKNLQITLISCIILFSHGLVDRPRAVNQFGEIQMFPSWIQCALHYSCGLLNIYLLNML